ncbi:MAG: NAD-dependent epimerase/dehydratase family protein [Actinomycetota bacterium]
MRVLVTGGLGFIGSHVVRALLDRGDQVTILDARTPPVHDPAHPVQPPEGVRMVEGDVRDLPSVDDALHGAEAVIHLAAYQDYGTDHQRFIDVNAGGTALLIERIAATGTPVGRFVLGSSQSVYGEGAVDCPTHGVIPAARRREVDLEAGDFEARCSQCAKPAPPTNTPPHMTAPVNAYGISKLAAERLVLNVAPNHGMEGTALRYAIVHGPGQSPRNAYSGILRAAVLRGLAGERPIVFEDGEARRGYLSIEDAVSATLLALDHPEAVGRAFAVSGDRDYSVNELLREISAATGLDLTPEFAGFYRIGDVRHTLADTDALRELGWRPTDDLGPVWREYVDWVQTTGVEAKVVDQALQDMRSNQVLRPFK